MRSVVRFRLSVLALLGLLLAAAPSPTAAQGIPVHDQTAVAQIIATVANLANIYARQNEELIEARRVMRAVTGAPGLGTIHETPALRQLRRRLPVLLADLTRLSELAATPELAHTLTLYGRLTDRYGLLDAAAYEPQAPDAPYAQAWTADRDAQLAAATSAEVVYGNVDQRADLYENLLTELDTRDNLKESVDLLARLTAENGRLLMDVLRLQAAATHAAATAQLAHQTHDARVRRMADYEDLAMDEWR